jgi:predicted site-specific integrase-resolvase
MIIDKPEVTITGLYNQRQAAEALHINRHTLARYEADGCIKFRVRKAGKSKVTTGAEIIKCWQGMYVIK